MSSPRGLVHRTLRFSSVDGPGNRFVVFLQGCNFDCINCHNPATIGRCNACGLCVAPCPEDALALADHAVVVDRSACTECDRCIEVCPYGATPLAREVEVDELLAELRETARFLSGVTVSGGEATLQADFVHALFAAIKADPELGHLSTLVDSNGSATPETWELLDPVMDGAMIDLKALDPDVHVRLTGRENVAVLRTIRLLAARGKLHEVRLLVVPGYTDDPGELQRTLAWLQEVDPDLRIRLIGFRRHGVRPEMSWLVDADPSRVAELGRLAVEAGFTRVVVV